MFPNIKINLLSVYVLYTHIHTHRHIRACMHTLSELTTQYLVCSSLEKTLSPTLRIL